MESKQPNFFVRSAIVILSIGLAMMVGYRFIWIAPRGQIDGGLLSLVAIIVLLTLSEAFDNFSVGKLVSVSRAVSKKDNDIDKLEKDKLQLISQLVSLSVNQTQSQTHTNVYGDYNAAVVSKATGQEIEEKKSDESAAQAGTPRIRHPMQACKPPNLPFR